MNLVCQILGHNVKLDDLGGGTLFQVCSRKNCTWVGRCVMDQFADAATKEEIVALNKEYGVYKILK